MRGNLVDMFVTLMFASERDPLCVQTMEIAKPCLKCAEVETPHAFIRFPIRIGGSVRIILREKIAAFQWPV